MRCSIRKWELWCTWNTTTHNVVLLSISWVSLITWMPPIVSWCHCRISVHACHTLRLSEWRNDGGYQPMYVHKEDLGSNHNITFLLFNTNNSKQVSYSFDEFLFFSIVFLVLLLSNHWGLPQVFHYLCYHPMYVRTYVHTCLFLVTPVASYMLSLWEYILTTYVRTYVYCKFNQLLW